MTDPTLQRGATNFTTSGSTTLTLYGVQSESFRKSANLIPFPLPTGDSSNTITFDILGVTREITIRGKVTSTDATIADFLSDLNGLIQGAQGNTGSAQVGYVFDPVAISGTFRVYVNEVSWDYVAGSPSDVEYSVSLLEVSTSSG